MFPRRPLRSLLMFWFGITVLFSSAVTLVLLCVYGIEQSTGGAAVPGPFQYPLWAEFRSPPPRADGWYDKLCFAGRRQATLSALGENVALWRASDDPHCRLLADRFAALFTVEYRAVNVSLPAPFRDKVLRWMGGSEPLVREVEFQRILHVTNNFDLHNMAFNPVRARRPQPRGSGAGPRQQLQQQVDASRGDCDFCRYRTMTAFEEAFGRPVSRHAVVVGNTFKLDGSHALVVSYEHDPLSLSDAARADMLALAERWCDIVHAGRPDLRFPSMVWDVGLHAGISQVHPHLHVLLSPGHYVGGVERLRRAGADFAVRFGGDNYFSALAAVHSALGLTVRLGSAVALAVVSPILDMEVWVLDANATDHFRRLYTLAVRSLESRLGRYCHSSGLALPALAGGAGGAGGGPMPALARLVSRGDCTAVRADVSSLELFALSSISADPYDVIRELRATVAAAGSVT